MKTLKWSLLLAITGIFIFFSSCENTKEELNGKVDFTVSFSDNNLLKSVQADSINADGTIIDTIYYWHLLVSIADENGANVYDDEIIPMYAFGDQFVSEKLSMIVGKYKLVKFMVIDPYGNVKYAAPLEGSRLAYLVNDPLPITFEISANQVSHLVPEVLVVTGSNPDDFGYASFGFNIVRPIVSYVMVVDDNPLYMRPSMAIPAILSVYARDGWHYDYKLTAGINKILIKSGYEYFKVSVKNPDYPIYEAEISAKEFINSSENSPLIFNLSGQQPPMTLILQPGPEEGKDAMITDLNPDKNFGDHMYFVASYLTEPVLTVMRTKNSLIQFNLGSLPKSARIESVLLTVAFERPVWDSLWSGLDDYMLLNQGLVLQQIVEPWDEYSVTWSNQPKTIEANQVFIPSMDALSSNIRTYDVTRLFIPMQEIAAPNYGMMLKLSQENIIPGGWSFASSDYPIKEMRPKLIVKYSLY
ncbi:MAG: DNRLRE domain-containing protein [Bacteroidales bacterium]|nr:DNRLRE domain-containing protein [Bacteroidales bacterium]MCF8389074.1 DNRLRE domain-containing protein [Bacteroidales bacterium]